MTPPQDHEAEWLTRKTRIDTKLQSRELGWKMIRHKDGLDTVNLDRHAVAEYPTENGPADYALFVKGKLLGIIEAKKVAVNPQNVLEQAKRYARGISNGVGNWNGLGVPFLYSTNGEVIWFLDVRHAPHTSRQITGFHSPSALENLFSERRQESVEALKQMNLAKIPRLRDYQKEAIQAIEKALTDDKRELLVAMATGTGKTYMTVAQIYRLMESGFAQRILFLVDRKALAAQAVREFNAFATPQGMKLSQEYDVFSQRFKKEDFDDDQPFDPKVLPNEYLTNPRPGRSFVYVSTIQRMAINLFGMERAFPQAAGDAEIEEDAKREPIPNNAFDVIIADECHRGYSAQEEGIWKETLMHFDSYKIGLTATPAAHTVALFGEPVFRYGVEQAICDGYLVDYEPVAIKSDVRINGLFLKEGEKVGAIDTETGRESLDQLEDERQFSTEEIERKVTAPDSNQKIIEEIAKYALKHENATGRFPKTLIFAVNDIPHSSHADQLVTQCRKVFGRGDEFVQKITGSPSVDRPLQKIREFRNRPNPCIVVTVDMLSTGVDIPALEFIVFLRPVKSRILWEQMLGRGTRRCDDINKSRFVIFDCFDGSLIRYFKDVSNFQIEEPKKDPITIVQIIENIYQNIDREYFVRVLVKRLRRIEKDMGGEARDMFAKWILNGDVGVFAESLPAELKKDFAGCMTLLRNPDFQNLLITYPRAKRAFYVAHEVRDVVDSYEVPRFGKFESADDYLTAFSQFVKSNEEKIAALRILLHQPKGWKPEVLDELRQTLKRNDFDDKNLERAHRAKFQKVVDIISMIKHAAKEQEPVYSPPERVERALAKALAGKTLSSAQQEWLALIREHLVKNLTLATEDFDLIPIFQRVGGQSKAKQLFGQGLDRLVLEINAALAA